MTSFEVLPARRCIVCSQPLQAFCTAYHALLREGKTSREALDQCGLPNNSPFLSPEENKILPHASSICCLQTIVTSRTLVPEHDIHQHLAAWHEGPEAVGVAPMLEAQEMKRVRQHQQQEQQQQKHQQQPPQQPYPQKQRDNKEPK